VSFAIVEEPNEGRISTLSYYFNFNHFLSLNIALVAGTMDGTRFQTVSGTLLGVLTASDRLWTRVFATLIEM